VTGAVGSSRTPDAGYHPVMTRRRTVVLSVVLVLLAAGAGFRVQIAYLLIMAPIIMLGLSNHPIATTLVFYSVPVMLAAALGVFLYRQSAPKQ
jgi:hypothetical protein